MADDPNLLEFSLDDDDSVRPISESAASNAISKEVSPSVDNEIQSHIDAIIVNITRNALPKAAIALITDYWKPVLIKCASEQGRDSFNWRDGIKKLTNLSLYLDSEASKQHPQIATKLLPALLNEMKQHITDSNLADASLNKLIGAIQNKSTDMPTEEAEDLVQQKATLTEAVESPIAPDLKNNVEASDDLENTLAFDVAEEAEIAEFEIDENDSFDFELAEEDVDLQSEQIEILEFELSERPVSAESGFVEPEQDAVLSVNQEHLKSVEIDELPPLDLEPFKDDK